MEELTKKDTLKKILEAIREGGSKLEIAQKVMPADSPGIGSYQATWEPVDAEPLNDIAWSFIADAYIVPSQYGPTSTSIKFVFIDGTCEHLSLSRDSKKPPIGERISPNNDCWFVTLRRGNQYCNKIKIK
jgi:hypothetical protein